MFGVLAVGNLGFELPAVPLRGLIQYLPRILGAVFLLLAGTASSLAWLAPSWAEGATTPQGVDALSKGT